MVKNALETIKKFGKRFSRVLMWSGSILLTIFILVEIAFFGGVIWLNSESGQRLVKEQLQAATKDAPYKFEFEALSYSFPQGLSVSDIAIADEQGQIATLDRVRIHPGLLGLGMRSLSVSISAQKLTIYRLPERQEEQEPQSEEPFLPLKAFALPDLYFNSFALNDLSIETLELKESVIGPAISLSPSLDSKISLGETLTLDLDLQVEETGETSPPLWMPERLRLAGNLNPQSLDLALSEFQIQHEGGEFSAEGSANLGENGRVDIQAEADIEDFSALAKDVEGRAEMNLSLAGPFDALTVASEGVISMPLLKERGLDDISFTINDENIAEAPLGRAQIKTSYQDKPLSLAATFNLEENILQLTSIKGIAPELSLNGQIDINTDTLQADGTLRAVIDALEPYSQMAGTSLSGASEVTIALQDSGGNQGAEIDAILNGLAYEDIALAKAEINARLADITNPWPDSLNAKLQGLRPAPGLSFGSADITLNQQEGDAYGLKLNASGRAAESFTLNGSADISGIRGKAPQAQNINLTLNSKGADLNATGQVDQQNIDITFETQNFSLASIPAATPEVLHNLAISGDATIQGAMAQPVIEADLALSPLKIYKEANVTLSATVLYQDGLARADITGSGQDIESLNGSVQLPLKLSLYPFTFSLPGSTALDGQLSARAQAEGLAPYLLPVGHSLRGDIALNGRLAGNIEAPDMSGDLSLQNGTYFYRPYGVELSDFNARAQLAQDHLELVSLSANDGAGGTLSGSGAYYFADQSATDITLDLENFRLLESDKIDGVFSAGLNLKGQSKGYLLSGDINLGEFDIMIPERFKSNIPELNIVEKQRDDKQKERLSVFELDLDINADDRIFVRGWGLDAEFGGNLDVTGTLNDPQLNGAFEARRGRYEEFGRRFTLDQAYLRFQGSVPPSPYLDISATTDADDIEATVNLTGPITDPALKLSSVPSLPEDEILSRVLFGKNLQNITPFQAIQLKQTLDRFTGQGGGGFNPMGKLRDLTGLDDIRVDTGDDGQATVGAGKYLTEDVYLELEKGAGEQSGTANIQVEVTPSISVESEIGQDAQAGAGVIWKWDY